MKPKKTLDVSPKHSVTNPEYLLSAEKTEPRNCWQTISFMQTANVQIPFLQKMKEKGKSDRQKRERVTN